MSNDSETEAVPVGKIDRLISVMEENTKATAGMSANVKNLSLIPIALGAIGVSSWLLWEGKLTEYYWVTINLVCLSSFFGDGVGRIIEKIPFVGKRAEGVKNVAALALLLGAVLLSGCQSGPIMAYDRKYSGFVDVSSETGGIEWTLTPAEIPDQGRASVGLRVQGSVADDKQIKRIWNR